MVEGAHLRLFSHRMTAHWLLTKIQRRIILNDSFKFLQKEDKSKINDKNFECDFRKHIQGHITHTPLPFTYTPRLSLPTTPLPFLCTYALLEKVYKIPSYLELTFARDLPTVILFLSMPSLLHLWLHHLKTWPRGLCSRYCPHQNQ